MLALIFICKYPACKLEWAWRGEGSVKMAWIPHGFSCRILSLWWNSVDCFTVLGKENCHFFKSLIQAPGSCCCCLLLSVHRAELRALPVEAAPQGGGGARPCWAGAAETWSSDSYLLEFFVMLQGLSPIVSDRRDLPVLSWLGHCGCACCLSHRTPPRGLFRALLPHHVLFYFGSSRLRGKVFPLSCNPNTSSRREKNKGRRWWEKASYCL